MVIHKKTKKNNVLLLEFGIDISEIQVFYFGLAINCERYAPKQM